MLQKVKFSLNIFKIIYFCKRKVSLWAIQNTHLRWNILSLFCLPSPAHLAGFPFCNFTGFLAILTLWLSNNKWHRNKTTLYKFRYGTKKLNSYRACIVYIFCFMERNSYIKFRCMSKWFLVKSFNYAQWTKWLKKTKYFQNHSEHKIIRNILFFYGLTTCK